MVNLKSLGKFLDFSICYLDKSTYFVQLDTLDLFASTHFWRQLLDSCLYWCQAWLLPYLFGSSGTYQWFCKHLEGLFQAFTSNGIDVLSRAKGFFRIFKVLQVILGKHPVWWPSCHDNRIFFLIAWSKDVVMAPVDAATNSQLDRLWYSFRVFLAAAMIPAPGSIPVIFDRLVCLNPQYY